MAEIRSLLNTYIGAHNLVNPREQAYINLDDLLYSCASTQSKTKSKGKDKGADPAPAMARFMKRDELTKHIVGKMQNWYEIKVDGRDPITKYANTTPVFLLI